MKRYVVVFLTGVLFAVGLGIAGMTQPAKVVDFLDFTGHWDASLALVMGGAVAVHLITYRLIRRRNSPLLASVFSVPTSRRIDWRLVAGSAVFGVGWGLAGYCPGPALTSIATGGRVLVLVAGMLAGMGLHEVWLRVARRTAARAAGVQATEPALDVEPSPGS